MQIMRKMGVASSFRRTLREERKRDNADDQIARCKRMMLTPKVGDATKPVDLKALLESLQADLSEAVAAADSLEAVLTLPRH
jgi:hypothetical protein